MKYGINKRILSLVLCISMLVPMLMQAIPVYSVSAGNTNNSVTTDYASAVGAIAEWDVVGTLIASNHFESDGEVAYISVNLLPEKLAIVDYAYDEVNGDLWYKVDAAPGYSWPDHIPYHWVYDYAVKIVSQNGMTGVLDADGNTVTKVEMGFYDEPVLSAASSLQGDVKYQWQIEYEEGKWADIYGATESKITVTIGILKTLLDENNTVDLRCISKTSSKTATSDPISMSVDFSSSKSNNSDFPSTASLLSAINTSNNIALLAETTENQKYTVTINYVFENNKQAWEPYTAEFAKGVTINQTVEFPEIQGYLPYLDGEQENSIYLDIDGNEVDHNKTYTVTYKPTNVNVTLIFMQQNTYDDQYTEKDRKVIQRLNGSTIEQLDEYADEYTGFYKLLNATPKVAADGSTEIEIKFNRNYFLMDFDLGDGGYGVQPVYARFDTEVEVLDPTRPGYAFKEWKDYDNKSVPSVENKAKFKMPDHNCTITAVWETSDAKYTIVYWKENADPNVDGTYDYSYWASKVVDSKSDTIVSGSNSVADLVDDEKYFTYNDARTDKNVRVKGDGSTVVNVYYTRNSYTIYFYGKGNSCQIPEHTHGTGCNSYLICGKDEHVHTDDCNRKLICEITEHTHSDVCCTFGTDHTHSKSCYENVSRQSTPSNAPSTPKDGQIYAFRQSKYIYISGTWYSYTGNLSSGSVASPICVEANHIHGDGNCNCSKTEHTHAESCYDSSCGKEAHTHTDACYSSCTLREHTHSNSCPIKDRYKVIYTITAKYDAKIAEEWPTAERFNDLAYWSGNGSLIQSSRVLTMNKEWCDTSDSLIEVSANYDSTKYQLNYWFEDFDQTSTDTNDKRKYQNGKYYVLSEEYSQITYYKGNQSSWSYKEITGMAASSTSASKENNNTFNLYYDRNRYTLKFQSGDKIVYTESNVMYEKPLNYYVDSVGNYIDKIKAPDYPEGLEKGAYEFAGWYTTPECFEGTKYDFTTGTMPNGDLTLFAKWTPVTHEVNFYKYKDDKGILREKIGDTYSVLHGSKLNEQYIPESPKDFQNGQYIFVGWFYMEGNVERAFSFESMTVRRDLDVYAKWTSNKLINYTFYFELEDGTQIADPVPGSDLAGQTITIDAKGGTDLYFGYQEGFFPKEASHSLLLDMDAANGRMEFIFVYEEKESVPYTVYYLAEKLKEGGTPLGEKEVDGKTYYIIADTKTVSDNKKAYVVETFKSVPGYMPDAYQKSKAIATEGTNEIYFYYTVDDLHTYYKITHYIQKLESGWDVYLSTELQGNIGQYVRADSISIPGFTFDKTIVGTLLECDELPADGIELKLYYTRNEYPYKVIYKLKETDEVLWESEVKKALYEKLVEYTADEKYGIYDIVGDSTNSLKIQIEADPDDPTINIIVFYYTERQVKLNYVIVAPDGTLYYENQKCGNLTSFSELVKISTGNANGSTAFLLENAYKFVGWYSDPGCKELLTKDLKYVPNKDGDQWVDGTTYYAKFDYALTSLTIKKEGWNSLDVNQTFIFNIKGNDGVDIDITVHGNGSTTIYGLTVGNTYTITEKTDWSWRYDYSSCTGDANATKVEGSDLPNGAQFTINVDGTVTFTNARQVVEWLDGDSWCNNIFTKN